MTSGNPLSRARPIAVVNDNVLPLCTYPTIRPTSVEGSPFGSTPRPRISAADSRTACLADGSVNPRASTPVASSPWIGRHFIPGASCWLDRGVTVAVPPCVIPPPYYSTGRERACRRISFTLRRIVPAYLIPLCRARVSANASAAATLRSASISSESV